MAVRVVTDSTAYLTPELVARHRIEVVSLHVTFAEGDSVPEVDLAPREFYARLASAPGLPHSSQPPAAEFESLFRRHVEAGDEVVGVFLSSEMSGTFAGAEAARDAVLRDLPDAAVELVDSRSNCMQLGFTALAAAEAADAGLPAAACAEAARHVVPRSRFLFTPATLEYLQRGGRIGRASALLGGVLQVRPILTVADGVTSVVKRVRTTRKAVDEIVRLAEADIARAGLVDVCVHHIDAEETAREVAMAFEGDLGRPVPLVPIGAVIGTHVGPGALGVVYRTREVLGRVGEG